VGNWPLLASVLGILRGAGADPAQPPADAEDRGADQRARVEVGRVLAEHDPEHRALHEPRQEAIGKEGRSRGTAHDEQQSHVVEQQEAQDALGLHHGRQGQSEAEQSAGDERRQHHRKRGDASHVRTLRGREPRAP
jgi:hypothetical protein